MKRIIPFLFLLMPCIAKAASPAELVDFAIRQSTWNIQIERVDGQPPSYEITFATGTTAAQKAAAAYIAATTDVSDSALQAFDTPEAALAASLVFSESRPPSKLERALILVLLDEINVIRANAALAPRTVSQLRTAIKNKLDSGAAN